MASKKHDFIVATISRKAKDLGFNIVYLDGRYCDITITRLSIPPKILIHRPDLIGENKNGNFCIGEAKTINDLKSTRTKQQLIDFYEFVNLYPDNFLIIGIPLIAENALDQLLKSLRLSNNQVVIIRVPEELLPKN